MSGWTSHRKKYEPAACAGTEYTTVFGPLKGSSTRIFSVAASVV